MGRKQGTPKEQYATADFIQQLDRADGTFKIYLVLFGCLIRSGDKAAMEFLDKLERYCKTKEGLTEIFRAGDYENEVAMLLGQQRQEIEVTEDNESNRILDMFRQCSPREKFLIDAYMNVSAAMNENGSDFKLQNAVEYDDNELPAELEPLRVAVATVDLVL